MIEQCCTFEDDDFAWCYYSRRDLYTKSKKDTICCECDKPIPAGIDHLISWLTGQDLDDGASKGTRIIVMHTCSFCTAILRDFFESNGSRIFNSLWSHMEHCHNISLSEATGAAR